MKDKKRTLKSFITALATGLIAFAGWGMASLVKQPDLFSISNPLTAVAEESVPENVETTSEETQTVFDPATAVETWDISATSEDKVTAYLYNDPDNEGYYVLSIEGTGKMENWTYLGGPYSSHKKKIKNVLIKDNIMSIGDYAFYGCNSLTEIVIPESVTSIGNSAFAGCDNLMRVSLGKKVINIGKGAFNCINLIDVYYTGDIEGWCGITFENIYSNPYYYADKLYINNQLATEIIEIILPNTLTKISNSTFCNWTWLTKVTIGDNVTSIGENAFRYCSNLKEIIIPDSVISIDDDAFYKCNNLMSIAMGKSVTSIGENAFRYCSSLKEIIIPDSVTSIGDYAFFECGNLNSAIISDSLASIGYQVFYKCNSLKEIIIPDSIISIDDDAFYKCTNLTSIAMGKSVTSIGNNAFYGCDSLTTVYYSGDISDWCQISFGDVDSNPMSYADKLYIDNQLITELIIPERVTEIKDYTFYNWTWLTSATIGDNVTSIGSYVFSDCSGLTKIDLPNSITSIGSSAFKHCSGLMEIIIPDSVTSIKSGTFSYCGFKEIIIPNSVTSIGTSAFAYCRSLTEIKIPNSVTSIGKNAFNDCVNVTSVSFEEQSQLINIGAYAFDGCYSLTEIAIPDNVTSIDNYAFQDCNGLSTVYLDNPSLASNVTSYSSVGYLFSAKESYGARKSIAILGENPTVGSYISDNYTYLDEITYQGELYTVYATHEHIWEDCSTESNCDECSVCGLKSDCKWGEWTVVKTPTEQTQGTIESRCLRVSSHVKTDILPKLDKNNYTYEEISATTCEKDGSAAYTYLKDGQEFTFEVTLPKLGHNYQYTYEWNEAHTECKATMICSRDSLHAKTEDGTVAIDTTNPTCVDKGETVYTATFESEGLTTQTYREELKAFGHDYQTTGAAVDATCTMPGQTEMKTCSRCGDVIGSKIIAPGHSFIYKEKVDASCYSGGYELWECNVENCDASEKRNETGRVHIMTLTKSVPVTTCVEDGYTQWSCECGQETKTLWVYASHNMPTGWTSKKIATCKEEGLEIKQCSKCDYYEERTIGKLAHSYIHIGDGVFECQNGCGDRYTVSENGTMETQGETTLYDCPTDFMFSVYCQGTQEIVEQSITIVKEYYYGKDNVPENEYVSFSVSESVGANVWEIIPLYEYNPGMTYVVSLSDGLELCGEYQNTKLKGTKLTFTIAIEEEKSGWDIAFNDGIKLVSTDLLVQVFEYNSANDYTEVILTSIDGLSIGDVICLSDALSLDEILLGTDYVVVENTIIGKIAAMYQRQDGTYSVKLITPSSDEVFANYQMNSKLKIDTSDADVETIENQVAYAVSTQLNSDEEFAGYLAAVDAAVSDFVENQGLSVKSNGKDILNFKFNVESIDSGFKITITITVTFALEGGGKIVTVLNLENQTQAFFENIGTKEDGFLYFNIRLREVNKSKVTFNAKYSYSDSAEDVKPFAQKSATGMIHRSYCRYVSYMKAPIYLDSCPEGATYCSICKPQDNSASMEEQMKQDLATSDWGKLLEGVQKSKENSALNKIIGKIAQNAGFSMDTGGKQGVLLGSFYAVAGPFYGKVELRFVFNFNVQASLNFTYESQNSKIYGIKNDGDGLGLYEGRGNDDYIRTDLRLMGGISANAGFSATAEMGALNLIAVGIELELGVYTQIAGVAGITNYEEITVSDPNASNSSNALNPSNTAESVFSSQNKYSALYFESGVYCSVKIYARLWILRYNFVDSYEQYPIFQLGYEKVYYAYAEPTGTLEIEMVNDPDNPEIIDLGNYSVPVKYLQLSTNAGAYHDLSTKDDNLALTYYGGHYSMSMSLVEDSDYCLLNDGKLCLDNEKIKADDLTSFNVNLSINVRGLDSWQNYEQGAGNSVYYLDDAYTIILLVKVHDWRLAEEKPATCCAAAYWQYACDNEDCTEIYEKHGEKDASMHGESSADEWLQIIEEEPATCYTDGWSEYKNCSKCGWEIGKVKLEATGEHKFNQEDIFTVDIEPTCAEKGWESKHCLTPGCSEKVCGREIEPNGNHSYVYKYELSFDMNRGFRYKECSICGHTTNSIGYAESIDIEFAHSCSFHNDLAINYYIEAADLIEYERFYLYIIKVVPHVGGLMKSDTIEGVRTKVSGQEFYKFTYSGIAAAEAGYMLQANLIAIKGDRAYESQTDEYSVERYAYKKLAESQDLEFKTLLVDMLNYCAAAQTYFKVDENNLVNRHLTEQQQSWATQTDVAISNDQSKVEDLESVPIVQISGKSVVFDNVISLKFYVKHTLTNKLFTLPLPDGAKISVSFMDSSGQYHSAIAEKEQFKKEGIYYVAQLNNLKIADLRCVLKVEILNNNDKVISDTVYYSVESYVSNRLNASTNEDFKELLKMLMKYSDSAKKYVYRGV